MLKGTLVMFCFRLFVTVVFNIMNYNIALIHGIQNKDMLTAKIINEILLSAVLQKNR